jgi:hypothetical protein
VYVTAKESRTEAIYIIRDEGSGFDASRLPDPTDSANLDRPGNRGLLLIRAFMDEVTHNAKGNEITMVKRRGGEVRFAGFPSCQGDELGRIAVSEKRRLETQSGCP